MKADLTRSTFRREKHYSGVLMQQGRVQLDADWNEQGDIERYLDETTRIDVIGRCGVPLHAAGFGLGVTADGLDLTLTPGRAYVDGLLCEADASPITVLELKASAALVESLVADGRELAKGDWVELSATGVGPFSARLTKVDPAAATLGFAPALAAGDADALSKAGGIVLTRSLTFLTQPDFPGVAPEKIDVDPGTYLAYLDVWERHVTALEDPEIREVALGGPDHGTRRRIVWQVRLERLGDAKTTATCATAPPFDTFVPKSDGLLAARAQPETTSADLCTIPPGAGFRRLENQLYRVEIHDPGAVDTATFTWSRENGSVVVAWTARDTNTLTVSSPGRDDVLGFAPGDWVELSDDTHELARQPGTLVKLTNVTGALLTIDPTTATGPLDLVDFPLHPKVRRWDDQAGARSVTVPATNDGFVSLEDGVEVRFEPGKTYQTGDYWLVPARTAHGDVEWPRDDTNRPLPQPPGGIYHHYCKLGLAELAETWTVSEDCRFVFPPLTEIGGSGPLDRIRVVKVLTRRGAFQNDETMPLAELARGIEIVCDRPLDAATLGGKPTCFVTLDLPFPADAAERQFWGDALVATQPVTLTGVVRVSEDKILWQPAAVTAKWLVGRIPAVLKTLQLKTILGHLTLKGNFVSAPDNPAVNVDGEAFGHLRDGLLDVDLPSGDGVRGGDLELWFWLVASTAATTHLAIGALASSKVLTSKARQTSVPGALALIVEREPLLAVLPGGYAVNTAAKLDPVVARRNLTRLKLPAAGVLRVAVEEDLSPTVGLLLDQIRKNELGLQLEVVPITDAVADFASYTQGAAPADLLIASSDALEALQAVEPKAVVAQIVL